MSPLPAPQIIVPANGGLWSPPYPMELEPGAAGFGAPAGVVYPGSAIHSYNGDPDQTTHFVLNQGVNGVTVPDLAQGWTVLYRQRPDAQQNGYWIGPFHTAYLTDWETASGFHYVGAGYPYPREPDATVANSFEISAAGGDVYVWEQGGFSDVPVYAVEYKTVVKIQVIGGQIVTRAWPMWVSASNKGNSLLSEVSLAAKSHPSAAQRCWIWGDARWNMGNERYNGLLQHPSLFTGLDNSVLTDAEVDLAFEDPLHPSVAGRTYFCNPSPADLNDITDKSGNNRHPTLVLGTSAPALSHGVF